MSVEDKLHELTGRLRQIQATSHKLRLKDKTPNEYDKLDAFQEKENELYEEIDRLKQELLTS